MGDCRRQPGKRLRRRLQKCRSAQGRCEWQDHPFHRDGIRGGSGLRCGWESLHIAICVFTDLESGFQRQRRHFCGRQQQRLSNSAVCRRRRACAEGLICATHRPRRRLKRQPVHRRPRQPTRPQDLCERRRQHRRGQRHGRLFGRWRTCHAGSIGFPLWSRRRSGGQPLHRRFGQWTCSHGRLQRHDYDRRRLEWLLVFR